MSDVGIGGEDREVGLTFDSGRSGKVATVDVKIRRDLVGRRGWRRDLTATATLTVDGGQQTVEGGRSTTISYINCKYNMCYW